jgi:23S rRNA (adenine2503-C2)-methyltransferase
MDLSKLNEIFNSEKPYRLKQAKKSLFVDLIENWDKATIFSLSLRERLNELCPVEIKGKIFFSKDKKTGKALIILKDNLKIESVLMRHKDGRNTLCLSSQVGCPLKCSFCATGRAGFKRNLEIFEIVEQVLFFARYLKKENQKVTNIVFMGMGEPFLNYENVLGAIRILNEKDGFNLGARHISISTVGILEGIKKLSEEKLQVNLAVSLHAPDDKLRSKMIPINEKYPIDKVLDEVDKYIRKTKRRVMFEYLMIKDLNDSEDSAKKLAELMKKPLYFVNLIPFNPTGLFNTSTSSRIKKFKEILEKNGIQVTQRYRFGQDIKAACGQLAF